MLRKDTGLYDRRERAHMLPGLSLDVSLTN